MYLVIFLVIIIRLSSCATFMHVLLCFSDTDEPPGEAVRKQRIAIFQCVRTSVNGVVKMLVVPISRIDQCLPVVVQQQRASGETRRAVVPAGSTITFGDDLGVLRARHVPVCTNARGLHVDLSGDAVSRAMQLCQRAPRVPLASIRLCVPRQETADETVIDGVASDKNAGSTLAVPECLYPSCDTVADTVIRPGYDSSGLADITHPSAFVNDVNVTDDITSSDSHMAWRTREDCFTDTAVTSVSPKLLQYNSAMPYDNRLSHDHDVGSCHETTAYDGYLTAHMSNDCSSPLQYQNDVKHEATNNVTEKSTENALTSIRIAHCCTLSRSWDGDNAYVEHPVYKAETPICEQEDFQHPDIGVTVMPNDISETAMPNDIGVTAMTNVKPETTNIPICQEYEVPHQNGYDSGNVLYHNPCSGVQPTSNDFAEETDVDNHFHLPINDTSANGLHESQYTSTKSEWSDQEMSSNWPLENIRHNDITYDNSMTLTCQPSLPMGNDQCQSIDDTSEDSNAGGCHENPEMLPKRAKHKLNDFDDASTLSAYHITECTVRLVPLSDTYTKQQSVYVTKPPSQKSVYSCKQLGPTTIKLVRKNNVTQCGLVVPGGDVAMSDRAVEPRRRANKARWVTGSSSSALHTTRRRSATRSTRSTTRRFVYIDSPLPDDILAKQSCRPRPVSEDVLRTQSLQEISETPMTTRNVSGGNCMLILTSSSASLIPLRDTSGDNTSVSSAGSRLTDSRTQLRQNLMQRSVSGSQLSQRQTNLDKMLQRSSSEINFASSQKKLSTMTQRSGSASQLAKSRTKLSRTLQQWSPRASVDPSTAFLRVQTRTKRGLGAVSGETSSTIADASRQLAESNAQCTRHLEQLLRYHEKVVLEVRALLQKNAKDDVPNLPTSLANNSI